MAAPVHIPSIVERYFAIEEASEIRHELLDGEIVAMASGSVAHDRVTMNLSTAVDTRLRGGPCRAHSANMRVKAGDEFCYPDLSITCGGAYVKGAGETLTSPKVVFEVLSPSTERNDRGIKFHNYEQVESLTDVVLIAQDKVCIDHFERHPGGKWLLTTLKEGGLHLGSVGITLPLSELFEGVDFSQAEAQPENVRPPGAES